MIICGIDEAGRGPVIGPMVICGLCVEDGGLSHLDVKDSKLLTPSKREKLFPEIIKHSKCYSIEIVQPWDLDELRKVYSLNEIEALYFAKIIERLKGDEFIVDAADVDEKRFSEMILTHLNKKVNIISKHKADRDYPVVSAASIIAKVVRDREIEKIKKEIGDFGSGYPSDVRTINFLKDYYEKNKTLPPYVRRSWKTLEKLNTLDKYFGDDGYGKTF